MVEDKKIINSVFIAKYFGTNSQIYNEAIHYLEKIIQDTKYKEHLAQRKSFYKMKQALEIIM